MEWAECFHLWVQDVRVLCPRQGAPSPGWAAQGGFEVPGSLQAPEKQPRVPVHLVKPLTAPHMQVQVQHCFYKIDNNSYSHIFLMRESSHQSKYIWGYWSCKAAGRAGPAQLLVPGEQKQLQP